MKKFIITIIVGAQMIIAIQVMAASDKCKIVEAEGTRLVLECKHETDGFKTGATVKIKTERKSSVVEGC